MKEKNMGKGDSNTEGQVLDEHKTQAEEEDEHDYEEEDEEDPIERLKSEREDIDRALIILQNIWIDEEKFPALRPGRAEDAVQELLYAIEDELTPKGQKS